MPSAWRTAIPYTWYIVKAIYFFIGDVAIIVLCSRAWTPTCCYTLSLSFFGELFLLLLARTKTPTDSRFWLLTTVQPGTPGALTFLILAGCIYFPVRSCSPQINANFKGKRSVGDCLFLSHFVHPKFRQLFFSTTHCAAARPPPSRGVGLSVDNLRESDLDRNTSCCDGTFGIIPVALQ